jgi:hypothetical protein
MFNPLQLKGEMCLIRNHFPSPFDEDAICVNGVLLFRGRIYSHDEAQIMKESRLSSLSTKTELKPFKENIERTWNAHSQIGL